MTRTRSKLPSPGPYLAEIVNHLDNTVMGGLEVVLLTNTTAPIDKQSNTYSVKYMSPFYGATSARFQGNDSSSYNDSQKSYGMWFVPPDVGTTVMVIFVNSDPNQGYWIGCVPDLFQNHMIPGLAASTDALVSPAQREKYKGAAALPVAEYNKKVYGSNSFDLDNAGKPVHPLADVLLTQGLLLDEIRGVTSSSARRERPSSVFGISTPGPLDPDGKKDAIGYSKNVLTPVSRLGGTTFVMDDGDIDGNNELVRIRTRTGHQILLHNTKDLIYIANSKGTAWLEFTSDGKVDIYAADSVSIHTEGDFNLRADRDFNLEAGRNFNILAETTNINANADLNFVTTNMSSKVTGSYSLTVDKDSNLIIKGESNQKISGKFSLKSDNSVAVSANQTISLAGSQAIQIDSALTQLYPGSASVKPNESKIAEAPKGINLFTCPFPSGGGGASSGLVAAMKRVPMHEPWSQHEDLNPSIFSKANTDASETPPMAPDSIANLRPGQPVPAGPGGLTGSTVGNSDADWQRSLELIEQLKKAYRADFNKELTINSGPRTREKQQELYDRGQRGERGIFIPTNPANYPGVKYFHLYAVDVNTSISEKWMNSKGWVRPLPVTDPVHYVYRAEARGPVGVARSARPGGRTEETLGYATSNAMFRSPPGVDKGTVKSVASPWSTDKQFIDKVKSVSRSVGIQPIDLLTAMNLETGKSFDPAKRNPESSATGLIQFLETTIAGLSGGLVDRNGNIIRKGSVDTDALTYMSRVEQLDWVEKYFKFWKWPGGIANPTLANVYLTIFLPASRFATPNEVIASPTFRADAYWANKSAYDKDGTGAFTPAGIAKALEHYKLDVLKVLEENALLGPNLEPLA